MLVCTDYNRGFRFIGKMCCYNILDTDDWVSEMISGIELLNLLYTNKINVCNILQRSNVSYEITPWSFSIVEDGGTYGEVVLPNGKFTVTQNASSLFLWYRDRGYKVLVSGCMQSCKIQMGENFIFTINIIYNGAMMNAFLVDKDSLQVMFLHLADVRHLDMFAVCNEKEFIKRVLLGD